MVLLFFFGGVGGKGRGERERGDIEQDQITFILLGLCIYTSMFLKLFTKKVAVKVVEFAILITLGTFSNLD